MEEAGPGRGYGALVITLFVGGAAGVALTYLGIVTGFGSVELSIIAIFFVSLLIGMSGALVFLVVQMLTEGDEEGIVLRRIVRSRYGQPAAMTALFVLSGGMVAGFSQASTGSFSSGNMWTTFLIGFGWQGVIAGVGGAAAARMKEETGVERGIKAVEDNSVEKLQSILNPLLQKVRDLEDQLRLAERGPPPPENQPLGQVL